jgi:hypothetical protein
MKEITLQIPILDVKQNIDIDVCINGSKKVLKYRVEIVEFDSDPRERKDTVSILKQVIREHDPDWSVVQISAPINHNIPITFKQKVHAE